MSLFEQVRTQPETNYLFLSHYAATVLKIQLHKAKENHELTPEQQDYSFVTQKQYKENPSLLPTKCMIPESVWADPNMDIIRKGGHRKMTNRWQCLISHMNSEDILEAYTATRYQKPERIENILPEYPANDTHIETFAGSNQFIITNKPIDL